MEPQSLETPESLVLDGANGVTRAPHQHFPDASLALGLALIAIVLGAVIARRGPKWVLVAALAIAAGPGLVQVLVVRADSPVHRGELSRLISSTLDDVKSRAPWPGATLVREDDDVMFPITRYAVPGRAPATGVQLESRGSQLGQPCRAEGDRQICGAGP